MLKALFVAEKPSMMREVQSMYKKRGFKDAIDFVALSGHVVEAYRPDDYNPAWAEWKKENLPMIPEVFKYKAPKEGYKKDVFDKARKIIKEGGYDYLICGTDAGREGNLIFDAFYTTIGCRLPVKRFYNNDTTEDDLYNSLRNMLDYQGARMSQLTAASHLRAHFDWLIGMNLTQAITINANKTIRVGRVKTPILKILADRELAIRNFVSKPFWTVEATFVDYKGMYHDDNHESAINLKPEAEKVLNSLNKTATVISVDKKRENKHAPELFSLSFLQAEANKVYRYTLQQTLEYTQLLYEKKAVSYPRTSSSHVTVALSHQFSKIIAELKSIKEISMVVSKITNEDIKKSSLNKKYVNDAKVTDHYAIIPTGIIPDFNKLSPEESNIYMLIVKRFVAIFLPPLVQDKTKIITQCGNHRFVSNGSTLVSLGHASLYGAKFEENLLPDVKEGDIVKVSDSRLIENKTSSPARFDDEMLIKSLINAGKFIENDDDLKSILEREGKRGIGTEATRANIVESLIKETLIYREKARFFVSEEGISIIETLGNIDLVTPKLTAIWEGKLTEVEDGKMSAENFGNEMCAFVKAQTEQMLKIKTDKIGSPGATMMNNEKKSIGRCPLCKENVVEGKEFYFCSQYKKEKHCEFILNKTILGAKIGPSLLKSMASGEISAPVKMRSPKTGKEFHAGLKYNTETKKIDFVFNEESAPTKGICRCPSCSGEVVLKSGQYGEYYTCTQNCGFKTSKVIAGKPLSESVLKKIVKTGKSDKISGFKKKDGSGTFDASLVFSESEKKLVFEF